MRLTKEIVEDLDSVDLSEFTQLDDDAAEALAKHEGQLNLSGLTSLSDAAAEALAKHEGFLVLSGLYIWYFPVWKKRRRRQPASGS